MRLIDADALFKKYERTGWYSNADRDKIAEEILLQMPTIDPESLRPQGTWIYHIDDLFSAEGTQECSNCHQEEKISLCNENYCPNCGAKMNTKKGDADD